MSNEVAVCDTCHALLHKGLLEVTGSVDSGLVWRRHPMSPDARLRDVEQLRERLAEMIVREEADRCTESTYVDGPAAGPAGDPFDPATAVAAAGRPAPAPAPGAATGRSESTYVDGPAMRPPPGISAGDAGRRLQDLHRALVRLGYPRREAEERIGAAVAALAAARPSGPGLRFELPDEADILMRALRG